MSNNQDTLSQDTVFDLLSSARRRYILYYLRQHGGEATINELASQIAVWENDVPEEELTSQDEKRVYVSLYQTHIPKLEERGIVEYDSDSSVVRLTDQVYQIDRYLTAEDVSEFPWQLYYLVVAVVGGLLFALSVLGVSVFAALDSALVGALVIGVFAVSAVVQYLLGRYGSREVPRELRIDTERETPDEDRERGERERHG